MLTKIASNTIAQVLSKVCTAFIAIFLISILTNYFPIEFYGLYSKIYNYIGMFVFLADLGLYAIAIREITKNKHNSKKIIGNVMSLRAILGIIILFLAVGIAFLIPGYNDFIPLLSIFIASFFTFFQLLNSSILSLMQANMKIEFGAFSIVLSKIFQVLLIMCIAYILFPNSNSANNVSFYNIPFLLIMIAGVISVIFNTFLNYFYARKIVSFGFGFDWAYIKHLFKISLPYGIALFLSVVYFKIDVIVLSIIEGPELGDISIALYSLPMKIIEVIMVVGGFYMTSLLPALSNAFKNKEQKYLQKLVSFSFQLLFSISCLIFTLGILFRDSIIRIIANETYLSPDHFFNSSDAFLIVFIVVVFYFISLVFIYCFIASEHQNRLLKINIIVTIFNIIGNIILIPKYSFIGAGITTCMSQILVMLLGYFYSRDFLSFRFPFLFILKNLLFGIAIYMIGKYILIYFSFGLYIDFFFIGGFLFVLYVCFIYLSLKRHVLLRDSDSFTV